MQISYLLYELKTRLKINDLATCSALTAGSSRALHFGAMSQLEKMFCVAVTNSVGEFTDWLVPNGKSMGDIKMLDANASTSCVLHGIHEDKLLAEDIRLLRYHVTFITY
jgi:hypothetical protein